MKADVRLSIDLIDENDPIWENMDTLGVSVMKGLSYADQTYIWVIDNGFTLPPTNHALTVGLERIELDIEPTAAIVDLLPGQVPTNAQDYSLSGIRAPYELSIESSNVQCPDPSLWGDKDPRSESSEIDPVEFLRGSVMCDIRQIHSWLLTCHTSMQLSILLRVIMFFHRYTT